MYRRMPSLRPNLVAAAVCIRMRFHHTWNTKIIQFNRSQLLIVPFGFLNEVVGEQPAVHLPDGLVNSSLALFLQRFPLKSLWFVCLILLVFLIFLVLPTLPFLVLGAIRSGTFRFIRSVGFALLGGLLGLSLALFLHLGGEASRGVRFSRHICLYPRKC